MLLINKEWYKKFLEFSNYNFFKEKLEKVKINNIEDSKDAKDIIKDNINTINFDKLQTLHQNNQKEINAKSLDNIENLAFISEKLLNKINEFMKGNNNSNNNQKKESKNNINEPSKNNIIVPNNKEIMIKNGQALVKMNEQKFVCFNPQEGNLNKINKHEIIQLPKKKILIYLNSYKMIKVTMEFKI